MAQTTQVVPVPKTGIGSHFRELVEQNRSEIERINEFRVFTLDYVPEEPIERPEMLPLLKSLAAYVNTGIPSHHIIVGGRGSGKTLFAHYLAGLLPKEYGLNVLYANCRDYGTTYKLLAHFLEREPRGYTRTEYYEAFGNRYGKNTVVILDEADSISRKDDPHKEIYYFLSRRTRCTTISLSNNLNFAHQLDRSIQSSLQPDVISFPPYHTQTIREILRQRARLGLTFMPEQSVLDTVGTLTHLEVNSDIRVAIRTLLLWAMSPGKQPADCFQKAREDIYYDLLRNLNEHHLTILNVIAAAPDQPVREIYRRYRSAFGVAPNSYVTFQDAVDLLASADLIRLDSTRVHNAETRKANLKFDRWILQKYLSDRKKQRECSLQQEESTH